MKAPRPPPTMPYRIFLLIMRNARQIWVENEFAAFIVRAYSPVNGRLGGGGVVERWSNGLQECRGHPLQRSTTPVGSHACSFVEIEDSPGTGHGLQPGL